jgi:hypothetical protein
MVARVCVRVWQVGFVVDKVAPGQVFSECFGFPCQNRSVHQLLHPHNHLGQTRRSLATSWSPVQGVLLTVLDLVTVMKRKVSWRRSRPKSGCRATRKKKCKGQPAHKAHNQLPRKWGSLNISQPYRSPWPVTGISVLCILICSPSTHCSKRLTEFVIL